jgi:hypothetical protein
LAPAFSAAPIKKVSWVVSGRVAKKTLRHVAKGLKYPFFHEIFVLRVGSVREFAEGFNR